MSLRFGVIGCGAIHGIHCDALQKIEGATLAGVMDLVPEKSKAAGEKYGVPHFSDLNELFDQVDAVTLGIPSGLHAEVGIAAARAGKHVISEKPIDVTYEAGLTLVEECERQGVKLATVSQHRFAPDIRRLRDAAQGGELGKLIQGDSFTKWYRSQAYYDSGDWRGTWKLDGGGCLMNQGVHYVDMIQWVMGGVKSVQARTAMLAHERIEVEDSALAIVEYNCGAIGLIQGSTAAFPGFGERLEVSGQYGTVIIESDRIKVWEVDPAGFGEGLYGRGVQSQPTPNVQVVGEEEKSGGASDPTAIWGEQHRLQFEDFVQAVRDDRDPYLTGREALEPVKVIRAIYASAARGGEKVEL